MSVWDTVIINDELHLLELRLSVLEEVVDRFVVVEADRTHTGQPKPYHVSGDLQRFARWSDRLEVVRVRLPEAAGSPWDREHEQKRAQRDALADVAANDLLLVGDLDEIPRAHVVAHLARHLEEPVRLVQRHAFYKGNWLAGDDWEDGTMAARGAHLASPMVDHLLGGEPPSWDGYREQLLPDAGWHFFSLGSREALARKLRASPHQEFNTLRDRDERNLARLFAYGVDLTGRRILTQQARSELDGIQERLFDLRPDLFDFEPWTRPRWQRAGVRSWTWARRQRHLPTAAVSAIDGLLEVPGPPRWALLGGLAALDRGRAAARARRTDPFAWKRGKWLDPIPRP